MACALFPRIPLACRAFPAAQRRSIWTPLRALLVGSPAHELFQPTSCRWLWDEERHAALHTRPFNVPALRAAAAEVLGVAPWRVRLNKFTEGGSNKVILARGGGRRVIIKLPDPAVPARVVTASEVAVMEFVRTELDIPAPKVLGWSWDSGGPVQAEYIIMEKADVGADTAGVCWPELELEAKVRVLKDLLETGGKMLRSSELFKDAGYGSLYFTKDAEALGFKKVLEVKAGKSPGRFCLGPLAEKHFWADAAADIDRGPWLTPQAYLTSLTDASLHHLRRRGPATPKTRPFLLNCALWEDHVYPSSFTTALLQRFRLLAPGLVHPTLSAPALWHPDLSHHNIFTTASGSISNIIDWQYAHILPLFLQAHIPPLLKYQQPDPEVVPDPVGPLGEDLIEEDNEEVQQRLELTAMATLYVDRMCAATSGELRGELRDVLNDARIAMSRKLGVLLAADTFETAADTMLLWSVLVRIVRGWEKIAPPGKGEEGCPVRLTQQELEAWEEQAGYYNGWLDLLDSCKMPRGNSAWVSVQDFEAERDKVRRFVAEILESFEDDETGERRERFVRHVKSWKFTDWNGGRGWIDKVDSKLKLNTGLSE